MKPKVIIHIGLPRTGTTFLQNEIYPKLEHINYISDMDFRHSKWHLSTKELNLISFEGLSVHTHKPEPVTDVLSRLKTFFNLFDTQGIVIGTRDFESWSRSCYGKYIMSGGKLTLQDYQQLLENKGYKTQELTDELEKLYPCYVYDYQEFKKDKQKTINELCQFLKTKPVSYEEKKYDPSPSLRCFTFIQKFNKHGLASLRYPLSRLFELIQRRK